MLQEQQAAVSAHHHGLASLLKLLAVMRAPLRLYANLVEGSRASSRCCRDHFVHSAIIGRPLAIVNLALRTGVLHSKRRDENLPSVKRLSGHLMPDPVTGQRFIELLRTDRFAEVPVHSGGKALFLVAFHGVRR